ncbi:hypothetical protein OIU76_018734 [Salix suchowensis]|nr:hypothetical protein OIU76_018734 [Salix suchowensis]
MAEIRATSMPNYKRKKFLTRDQASMSFSKRTKTLKKKAQEIQTLCDVKGLHESKLFDLKEKVKLSMQRSKVKATQDRFDMELEMDGSSVPSRAAGATESPAEAMDTNIDVVETVGNNNKDAACSSFEMPPLPKDSSDWMENFTELDGE